MKSRKICLLAIVLIVITSSCTTLKRYKSIEGSVVDSTLADIDLFAVSLSQAGTLGETKSIWDLSADAQSQYIKILNSRYPDNNQFIEAMNFQYLNNKQESLPDDYISKDLRMVFSVSKLRDYSTLYGAPGVALSPADRIEYLNITLQICDDSLLKFTGWNKFTTEYGSVDIADVSYSRTLELEPDGLLKSGKEEAGAELSGTAKTSISSKEDQKIKYRYLVLNGRISNNAIEMEEEGMREIDLSGNIIADVSLKFEKFPERVISIRGLTGSNGTFNDPDSLLIRFTDVNIPMMESIKDTIFANLKMDYIFRNVLKGRRTFPEWDDHIKYYTGRVEKRIPLFTSSDYVPGFYCIGIYDIYKVRDIIKLESPDNKDYPLIFSNHEEAEAFYDWLVYYLKTGNSDTKPLTIGGFALKLRNNPLKSFQSGGVAGLRILPMYM